MISITILFSIAVSFVGFVGINFSLADDKLTPADLGGDGKSDLTVFRPSTGGWYASLSSNNAFFNVAFGTNGDIPTPLIMMETVKLRFPFSAPKLEQNEQPE